MRDLVDTVEMYLRTIYDLVEEGVEPRRARIAERLEQTQPTVGQTVARMQRDGLVRVLGDRRLELTDAGLERAAAVTRKHRIVECLLVDVIGLEWEFAHAEACRWEHVVSDRLERSLIEMLNRPTRSPYGNPIPGLAVHGACGRTCPQDRLIRLTDVRPGSVVRAVIRTISEHVQSDSATMATLRAAGVAPDARVDVETGATTVTLTGPDGVRCALPTETAHAIHVRLLQEPSPAPSANAEVRGASPAPFVR